MRSLIRAATMAIGVVAAIVLSATPQAAPAASNAAVPPGRLRELRALDDLKAAFNRDRGRIRIVLLLSPT